MIHLPDLIQDLGYILIAAAIVTLIFKKLKQPVVLGYLMAGFLVGPHVTFIPTVTDVESVKVWAEIGVIFLLFSLGLEFSFKKLVRSGRSATITALFEIIFMLGAGFWAGQFLGWSRIDSLFLGGILSISSTTIIVRSFSELNMRGRSFVSLVFGVLIVEDIVAILLLVLLTSVAATKTLSGSDLAFSSLQLMFFIVLCFVLGIYLLPVFLNKIKSYLSDETTLLVAIGLCLFMVMVAAQAGFTPALGAFIMGSILAETKQGHRMEILLVPVRDLFAAVFFVSVGMMIDPKMLSEHFWVILLISTITIVGKLFSSTTGALLSGTNRKDSIHAGMSLAQIGEFSFIIATLGLTLKVTSDFLYPIAVAVSAITTFTTPYMIKNAEPFSFWIESKTPKTFKKWFDRYEVVMSDRRENGTLRNLWQAYGIKILLNSVIVIAVTLAVSHLGTPHLIDILPSLFLVQLSGCLISLVISAPFLWAVVVSPPKATTVASALIAQLKFVIFIFRFMIGTALIIFIMSQFVTTTTMALLFAALLLGIALSFRKYAEHLYLFAEKQFMTNLNDQDGPASDQSDKPQLVPWNVVLTEFVVSPHSPLAAHTLQQAGIKENFGVTIAMIERGEQQIFAPERHDLILPYDRISGIGKEEELTQLRSALEVEFQDPLGSQNIDPYGLTSFVINTDSPYTKKAIRDCNFREDMSGLVVGIERDDTRVLNPDASFVLQAKDRVWIVCNLNQLSALKR